MPKNRNLHRDRVRWAIGHYITTVVIDGSYAWHCACRGQLGPKRFVSRSDAALAGHQHIMRETREHPVGNTHVMRSIFPYSRDEYRCCMACSNWQNGEFRVCNLPKSLSNAGDIQRKALRKWGV
jgi:hypothetical protein